MAFKILSLNGGGVRGMFQTAFLETVSQQKDVGRFWESFDLIAGTSAGAIVAAGLWAGRTPTHLNELFESLGPDVFPISTWTLFRYVRRKPLFDQRVVKNKLTEQFGGDQTFGNKRKPLLAITATYLDKSHVRVFCPLTQKEDRKLKITQVVLASTAAPGAFPPVKIDGDEYIDGGLWANNPSLAAVALAIEKKKVSLDDIYVVNIGNGEYAYSSDAKTQGGFRFGTKDYFRHMYNIGASSDKDTTEQAMERMLGDRWMQVDVQLESEIALHEYRRARAELFPLGDAKAREEEVLKRLKKIIKAK